MRGIFEKIKDILEYVEERWYYSKCYSEHESGPAVFGNCVGEGYETCEKCPYHYEGGLYS